MNLQDRALLVSLSCRAWSAKKQDKKLNAETASHHGISEDQLRTDRKLFVGDPLKTIRNAQNHARQFFHDQTLPWDNEGQRVLATSNFAAFEDGMTKIRTNEFEPALRDLILNYPDLLDKARIALNGTFDPDQYPASDVLASKFGIEWKFLPFPVVASDWRVKGIDADMEVFADKIRAGVEKSVHSGMRDVWVRLHAVASGVVERLADVTEGEAGKFHGASMVRTANEVCELLPRLNLLEDPKLDDLVKRLKAKVNQYAPGALRADPRLRQEVRDAVVALRDEAEAILEPVGTDETEINQQTAGSTMEAFS